jgi:chorismate mutase/prephenate dehydratase
MSDSQTLLDDLRRRIDEIDDQLHDLLMQRTEIVAAIGREKQTGNVAALRPGREAMILRRLMARHRGNFSRAALVRMWRELLSTTVGLQTRFAVAVYAPEPSGYWDIARDHFGSNTPLTAFRSVGQVIHAVTEGQASVGILPMPREDDSDPWWRFIMSPDDSTPRILARLPFGARGNARHDGGDALVIGSGTVEATGDDCSLVVVEASGDLSRARLFTAAGQAGLACSFCASYRAGDHATLYLMELTDFVPPHDPRLAHLCEQLAGVAIDRIVVLGTYATPLALGEPSGSPAASMRPAAS